MKSNRWLLTNIGRIAPNTQWRLNSERHEFSELIMVIAGTLHVKEPDGTTHTCRAGTAIIYPAGCYHEEESDRDDPVETIFFGFKGQAGKRIETVDDRDNRIRTLGQWIFNSRQDGYIRTNENKQALFNAVREEYIRLSLLPVVNDVFSAINGFVLQNLGRKITLDELAASAHLSKFHFLREYKKNTGQSPMATVRRIRIEEAKSLIEGTNLPLKVIAVMVGMGNEYQLSASMKKHTGHSPNHFRKHSPSLHHGGK